MSDYELGPGVLKINKDLGWILEGELREQCRDLLEDDSPELTIDISSAEHVCSANLVVFAYVGAMAGKAGKSLKMVVSERTARSFQLAGFGEFVKVEIAKR
jgi:anti-anti-sigma regulatory factor